MLVTGRRLIQVLVGFAVCYFLACGGSKTGGTSKTDGSSKTRPSDTVGDECSSDTDCRNLPSGYCPIAEICTRTCTRHSDCGCPAGTTTSQIENGGVCTAECVYTSSSASSGYCFRYCSTGAECSSNTICYDNLCLPPSAIAGASGSGGSSGANGAAAATVGKACTSDSNCLTLPGGYCPLAGGCTAACASHSDCGCPSGMTTSQVEAGGCSAECVRLSSTDTSGYCFRVCASSIQCEGEEYCDSVDNICVPPITGGGGSTGTGGRGSGGMYGTGGRGSGGMYGTGGRGSGGTLGTGGIYGTGGRATGGVFGTGGTGTPADGGAYGTGGRGAGGVFGTGGTSGMDGGAVGGSGGGGIDGGAETAVPGTGGMGGSGGAGGIVVDAPMTPGDSGNDADDALGVDHAVEMKLRRGSWEASAQREPLGAGEFRRVASPREAQAIHERMKRSE